MLSNSKYFFTNPCLNVYRYHERSPSYHVNIWSNLSEPRQDPASVKAENSHDLCVYLGDAGLPPTLLNWLLL